MAWTKAQEKAIHHEGESILVSAGAGSGKTGVLKERVIAKLKKGVHIDQLVILTFTRAAAEEMKTRIINALIDDEGLQTELNRINHAQITTFDAFCLSIVKRHHHLLELPKEINIADRIIFETMAENVLEKVIEKAYSSQDLVFDELVILTYQKGDRLLYETIKSLAQQISKHPKPKDLLKELRQQQSTKTLAEAAFRDFEAYLRSEIVYARRRFQLLNQRLADIDLDSVQTYALTLDRWLQTLEEADIDDVIKSLRTTRFPRKPTLKNDDDFKDLLDIEHNQIKAIISQLQQRLERIDINCKEDAIASVLRTQTFNLKLLELTEAYLDQLAIEKRKHHLYDFSDIMVFAIVLLEKYPKIKEALREDINEIMVDEYQDTNDLQDYLLALLEDNNLFMVGDIKQSIYGFRDANPENFYRRYQAYQKHQGGIAIDLRENFRSRRSLIEDINQIFALVMDEAIGGINYQDGQSLVYGQTAYDQRYQGQAYGITYLSYDLDVFKDLDETLDASRAEALIVSADIRRKIDEAYQVFDLKTGKFRPLQYQDIAILIDRKTAFDAYTETLSRYGIPVNLYSDEPFIESPEMLFLTSYLAWLKCFVDKDYFERHGKRLFYSVARSFVYQINDEIIIKVLVNHDFRTKEALHDLIDHSDFHEMIQTTIDLAELIDQIPVTDLLLKIYQSLALYQKIAYLPDPAKKEAKLDYFYETIAGFDELSFDDLIDYLETINKHDDWDIEYSTPAADVDAVKLMTFHKSKGLQFPLVYCPGLNKPFNFEESKAWFMIDKSYGMIAHDLVRNYQPTFIKFLSIDRAKRAYISERIRLLYVAMTRAKENLVLIAEENDIKAQMDTLEGNYISQRIRSQYRAFTDLLSSTPIPLKAQLTKPPAAPPKREIIADVQGFVIEKRQFNYEKKIVDNKRFSKSSQTLLDDETIAAIDDGSMLHHQLEKIDFHRIDDAIKSLPKDLGVAIGKLYQSEVFDSKPFEVYQEYAFIDEGRYGIIDLMVITEQRIDIVDYKLRSLSDEAYVQQLKGYHQAIAKRTQKEVRSYLYAIKSHELKRIT